jgi:hypothetical protein
VVGSGRRCDNNGGDGVLAWEAPGIVDPHALSDQQVLGFCSCIQDFSVCWCEAGPTLKGLRVKGLSFILLR